jgi:hypothetical protein
MGLFKKRHDPLAERERELNARIAMLQGQIKHLNERIQEEQAQPKLRSTALPHAQPVPPNGAGAEEATFEEVNHHGVHHPSESGSTPSHYTELGVRKYDLGATWRRWLNYLRGSPTPNPKLVNYLAAGSIHGLRPLRYEKRVARNRFLALCAFFVVVLWGLIYFYVRNR